MDTIVLFEIFGTIVCLIPVVVVLWIMYAYDKDGKRRE